MYGASAAKRSYEASFFDYAKIEDSLIVERVQQGDVLAQMRQLHGRALGLVGVGAMFMRNPMRAPAFPCPRHRLRLAWSRPILDDT